MRLPANDNEAKVKKKPEAQGSAGSGGCGGCGGCGG